LRYGSDLGFGGQPALLTTAEIPVALACLAGIGSMASISRHYQALGIIHIMTIGGAILLAFSTYLFGTGIMSPLWWMIVSGSGLFLPYLLFNGVLFDRLLAAFKETGNVGFLMYIADSTGYIGSAAVLFWKTSVQNNRAGLNTTSCCATEAQLLFCCSDWPHGST
jgi:hypothetical protein